MKPPPGAIRRVAAVALVLAALGCERFATSAAAWPGAPFTPPAAWRAWWEEVAGCAGVDPVPSFERVTWRVAPDGALGPQVLGRWEPPHSIWLTAWVVEVGFKPTVAHEMLHDHLRLGGDEQWHPPDFARCGL